MSDSPAFERLVEALRSLGIHTTAERVSRGASGFPIIVTLPDGETVALDLPQPALISTLDPSSIGVAILDHVGYARQTWGLAEKIPYFDPTRCVLETEIASLIEGAYRDSPGSLYYQGYRYYASGMTYGDTFEVFVLVTDAQDEQAARQRATRSGRDAEVLKKVGRALTVTLAMEPLATSAVHAVASTSELAAVLLWVRSEEDNLLHLRASVVDSRSGTKALQQLDPNLGVSCVAELCAARLRPLSLARVSDSAMTAELEAKFCYLKPGGITVLPLTLGEKLIGVLELIGRDGDEQFDDHENLFLTIAEHLSLALNSALMYESVQRLASFDALTGIANHRTMQEFLHYRIAEAERNRHEIGVIMMDVDNFRAFNEEEGHDAGDRVLKSVAEVLRTTVRPYDQAARYGGEEFTVIMPGVGAQGTMAIAERIRELIEGMDCVTPAGRHRRVTVSMGCATYPTSAADPPSVLKAADIALYQAKRAGRNRAILYEGYLSDYGGESYVDFEAVLGLLPSKLRKQSRALAERAEPYVRHVGRHLRLSKPQESALLGAVASSPYWRSLVQADRAKFIESVQALPAAGSMATTLRGLDERYDGAGPGGKKAQEIPLLCRTLAVLVALFLEDSQALCDDPGRFDPEIVGLVGEVEEAA